MTDRFNIALEFLSLADSHPDQPALILENRPGAAPRFEEYSFNQLAAHCAAWASRLRAAGVGRGTRVALMAPPGLELCALAMAIIGLGAVPVVIDPGLGLGRVKRSLASARPEAFVGTRLAHLLRIVLGWGRPSVRIKMTVPSKPEFGGNGIATDFPFIPMAPADPAAIIFTSGSTGPSKGVVLTHGMLRAQLRAIKATLRLEPGDRDFGSYPLLALFAPALGMTSILPRMDVTRADAVNPARMLDAIQLQRATTMFGSPALIRRLGYHGSPRGIRLPSLRLVVMAGAPADARSIASFLPMLDPAARFLVLYGASEGIPVCMMDGRRIVAETDPATARGAGVCLGPPLPHIDLRIIAPRDEPIALWSDDLQSPRRAIGEIVIRGEVVAGEYLDNPAATALARIDVPGGGHFHRTGDLGYLDPKGNVWFCGRKSQRVVAETRVFDTVACERVFSAHPAVRRAALVGVKINRRIEPLICIELEPHARRAKKSALKEELLALGARQEVTQGIRHLLFHRGFPVDRRHSSKIGREDLAKWAEGTLKPV